MTTLSQPQQGVGIAVMLPDGSVRRFDSAVSGADVAADIGPGLAKAAIAVSIDGAIRDLDAVSTISF